MTTLPALGLPRLRLPVPALVAVVLLFACSCLAAQDAAPYKPARGQAGKDVVWIPTPDALVTRMLKLAQVTAEDFVVDLGAGDGKIVIAAADQFGAKALGLEFDPDLVAHARRNAEAAGVSGKTEFRQADIFTADFSAADVVTMYLLPDLNLKLRSTLMAMKPGTRVVSHQFTMGNWRPDETSWVQHRPAYLWIVPANAGGTWQASYAAAGGVARAELFLEQVFQDLKGAIEFGPIRTSLRNPRLTGSRLEFGFTDAAGVLRHVDATLSGDHMKGQLRGPGGTVEFSAQRQGVAPPVAGAAPVAGEELQQALRQLGE
jgi:SAM-dependent methyltransferase